MMLHVPEVLTRDELAECRALLADAPWMDGAATAGGQAVRIKRNAHLPEDAPAMGRLRSLVRGALARSPLFLCAALPLKSYPPLFNRYADGGTYGNHVDNALMGMEGGQHPVRSDVSCTLFLTEPDDYGGGELVVEDTYGTHRAKLPAGDMILYPSTSLHRVEPVTRGARVSCFFWSQSMVRDDWKRSMLFDLDRNIQALRASIGDQAPVVALTSHYHNLIRLWAEV
ncbi:Fe2+-dependent dioxygenase [Denitromonas iodatirespirans]|uniref:Fe2+-dependent dioxygenase n=1 Tax=Denitromonas iodatirespirans TaxID=2795389 RepID=A0A944DE10_DENI1|nr:Fe2+-dependent dioxygenase [Denitromonas iodatirespirans]MBT0962612.1 Fe2+-dependent dioxygenase [Denitromonas iodatirespirans]